MAPRFSSAPWAEHSSPIACRERLRTGMPLAFGVSSMAMGVVLIAHVANMPVMVIATVLGALIGELIRIEDGALANRRPRQTPCGEGWRKRRAAFPTRPSSRASSPFSRAVLRFRAGILRRSQRGHDARPERADRQGLPRPAHRRHLRDNARPVGRHHRRPANGHPARTRLRCHPSDATGPRRTWSPTSPPPAA